MNNHTLNKSLSDDPWDKLKVGCIICPPAEQYGYVVLEITKNLIAIRYVGELVEIHWRVIEELKGDGWTIKNSTPKEEIVTFDEFDKKVWEVANKLVKSYDRMIKILE